MSLLLSPQISGGDDVGGEGTAARKDLGFASERACQICFDQNYSTVMLPCGHGGLCWECGLHIYALTEECPMCRTKIELVSESSRGYYSKHMTDKHPSV